MGTSSRKQEKEIFDLDVFDSLQLVNEGQIFNENGEPFEERVGGELGQCANNVVNAQNETLYYDGNVVHKKQQEMAKEESELEKVVEDVVLWEEEEEDDPFWSEGNPHARAHGAHLRTDLQECRRGGSHALRRAERGARRPSEAARRGSSRPARVQWHPSRARPQRQRRPASQELQQGT